nr:hypothetical protein [Actinomycetota bacterium]
GRTTLLRHLTYSERRHDRAAVFIDGGAAADLRSFVDLVAFRLAAAGIGTRGANGPIEAPGGPPGVELIEGLAPVEATGERVLLLLDGIPAATDAHTFFGRLRDSVWQLPYTWVVGAGRDERGAFLTPPADAFFEVVVDLPPFDPRQQLELLRARLEGEDIDPAGLVTGQDLSPRVTLEVARAAILLDRPATEVLDALGGRAAAAGALGGGARMLFDELESLGPVSASDDRLLTRLGWTRERAVQVFKQLEDAGLVTSYPQKGAAGRPRKVYKLVGLQPDDIASGR